MAKILLIEDDVALRDIYSIRLAAEGYEVVSAGDGEEALVLIPREKPDLIIADVMMPKMSGFDVLDIVASMPELRGIKTMVMTALSSEEQRARGEALGVSKYLVKSQVGIEDVVAAVHEVLGDRPAGPVQPSAEPMMATASVVAPVGNPVAQPAMPVPPVQVAPVATAMSEAPVNPIAVSPQPDANVRVDGDGTNSTQ